MKQYNLAFLQLHLFAMQGSAYSLDVINNFWKISAMPKVRDAFKGGGSIINTPTLFPFLLSSRNRNAPTAFGMAETAVAYNEVLKTGKKGMIVTIKYMPALQMDEVSGGNGLMCDFNDQIEAGYQKYPYELTETYITKKIKIDDATVRCLQESKEGFIADSIANLWRAAISGLAKDVEAKIYNVDNGYIGDFPDRNKGVNTAPGKLLNLFRNTGNAYNEVNWIEESNMKMDIKQASITDIVYFGGTVGQYYSDAKKWSIGNTSIGFDITKADAFNAQNFIYDDYLQLGIINVPAPNNTTDFNPLLAIRPGALQFISRARSENPSFQANKDTIIRIPVTDPVWGLTWDMNMKFEECSADGEFKWFTFFTIDWTVMGYPQCDFATDPKLKQVRDVFLYNIQCGDNPVCNEPADKFTANIDSVPLDDDCDLDEVCDPGCKVSLSGVFLGNGDFQITSFPIAALGADPLVGGNYAWAVNGGGVGTPSPNPNILVLDAGTYTNKENVTLIITDSTGCVADANVVISVPELQVTIADGTTSRTLADSGTETLTPVTVANSPTVNVALANLGLDPLKFTTWTLTGDIDAGFVQPTVIATAPVNVNFTFDVTGGAGTKTVILTIDSNDPTTPNYVATIEIVLTT